MDFTPGYVLRALDYLPKAGHVAPWRLKQNYLLDLRLIRHGKVDDEALHFSKHRAAGGRFGRNDSGRAVAKCPFLPETSGLRSTTFCAPNSR